MIYLIDTNNNNNILDSFKNSKIKFGCDATQILERKIYEAIDNPTATQLSDLTDPIDVTSKRIYLVE